VETDSGKVVRGLKSTCKRHGTRNLFAALEGDTGQVHTNFTEYKKRGDFPATDLRNKIAEVAFGQPFTEDGFRVFLENQIRPLYEAKGYMHVTFPKIAATPATDVLGVHVLGIDVKVTVDEGALYGLYGVTVGPRMAADSARILKTAGLTGFDELTSSADRVRLSMRHQGYLDADVITENKRDDEKKTVEFVIDVDAGPEYKFGKLRFSG